MRETEREREEETSYSKNNAKDEKQNLRKATAPQREQGKCHFELLRLYFKARIGSSECSGIMLAV